MVTGSEIDKCPSTSTRRCATTNANGHASQVPVQSFSAQAVSTDGQDSAAMGELSVPLFDGNSCNSDVSNVHADYLISGKCNIFTSTKDFNASVPVPSIQITGNGIFNERVYFNSFSSQNIQNIIPDNSWGRSSHGG